MRQSTIAQRWPNSARVAWLQAKAQREAERNAARWSTPRTPKAPPSRGQELKEEILKLLEPLAQSEQVTVLEGIRDYLTHLRVFREVPGPADLPPTEHDYSEDIPF